MFKKPVEAKLSQRLSGADKKKLRRTVKEKFQHASDANIDEILPPKAEITVVKCSNKVHVYVIEGGLPMLFDIDGRGTEIYPTVYALWKVSELLPSFLLKGGEVSRYVIGGADLMFPGISIPPEGLPSFLAGQPWAVKVPGNPSPIAVGVTTMSSSEALKAGLRGKALKITHYYRDFLWQSAEGHYVPNAGFFEDVVMEDPDSLPVSQPLNLPLDVSNDEDVNMSEREIVDILNTHVSEVIDAPANLDSSIQNSEEIMSEISGLKVSEKVAAESSSDDKEQQILSTEEIDALLDKCLLQALHTTVKDKDLPIPGSTLWSNHILPCRPAGVTLDIKRSSHKKLSKWLQSKSSTGLISGKEDKYKKEFILLGINRGHSDYMSFKPEKHVQQSNEQKHDSSAAPVGRPPPADPAPSSCRRSSTCTRRGSSQGTAGGSTSAPAPARSTGTASPSPDQT